MHENTRHLSKKLSIPLALCTTLGTLLIGMLSGLLSGSGRGYSSLVLPPLTPPDMVFPIVWSVMYLSIGLALYFILHKKAFTPEMLSVKKTAVWLWVAQIIFNFCWSFAFFSLRLYAFSFVWLLALAAINMALIIVSFRVSKPAGWLLIPYEAWLLFACYLNLFIAIMN